MARTLTIDLDFHPTQAKVFFNTARFKVLFCGRRWGKTAGAVRWLCMKTLGKRERLGWWVSPTYRQSKVAFRYFRRLYGRSGIIQKVNNTDLSFQLVMGCRLEFLSAEIPDNMRGNAPDFLVLDEFASMPEMVWTEVLRSTLMDSKGEAVFIGTPKGLNWAHALWLKGKDAGQTEWKSWQYSTYDNPYIAAEEIKAAEADMPEVVARQEIHAEPMEGEGIVFRNVDELSKAAEAGPIKGETYMMGVDLAKYRDFTVLSVMHGKTQVYLERFNKIDWAVQRAKITRVSKLYNNAEALIDSTGVGDPIFEELSRAGLHVTPYQLNSRTKRELIDTLIVRMDKKELTLLDNPVQKGELKAYQYELTSGGTLRMNAPAGQHDDTVIALALSAFKAPVVAKARLITNKARRTSRF